MSIVSLQRFPILYKYTNKGQVQQWQIFVHKNSFYTEEGIKGGILTTSLPTWCEAKNVGRSNETTPYEQAVAEAKAKHQKKLDKGYNEVLTYEKKFFEPMLAKDALESDDIDFTRRTFVQPKLDGLRAINEENSLASRNGKPYLACPHLYQDEVTLDGELYNHNLKNDFNKIVSLCKKQKPTKEELDEAAEKVEFWVYDFPDEEDFSVRYEGLKFWMEKQKNPRIKLVPTYEVFSWKEIDDYHKQFKKMGFEGTMIRIDMGPYENKRSKQLLKYKDFYDDEYEITGAQEGKGGRAGTIGFFELKTKDGKEFKSNVKGNFEFLKQVWKDKQNYIGTEATVKYQNLTPDGVPRFPYIIKLNRKEYE